MSSEACRIATVAVLAALLPAQAWQLPERGVAFYKRQRTATGTKVAWGGTPDPNHDPRGVRGSGFNDIYPLFSAP